MLPCFGIIFEHKVAAIFPRKNNRKQSPEVPPHRVLSFLLQVFILFNAQIICCHKIYSYLVLSLNNALKISIDEYVTKLLQVIFLRKARSVTSFMVDRHEAHTQQLFIENYKGFWQKYVHLWVFDNSQTLYLLTNILHKTYDSLCGHGLE